MHLPGRSSGRVRPESRAAAGSDLGALVQQERSVNESPATRSDPLKEIRD